MKLFPQGVQFWSEIYRYRGSATPYIVGRTLAFGLIALAVTAIHHLTAFNLAVPITPYEVLGAALGALLVLRTNAGYERWWEARKLWGGIVNQCRNVVVLAVAHGPDDPAWKRQVAAWTAAFPHACRRSLRNQRESGDLESLIGAVKAERIVSSDHMPTAVSLRMSQLFREGAEAGMDRFAFLRVEDERAKLIDHLGGCERILRSPLPLAYSVQIRQFIFVFLFTLPFGLVEQLEWLTPVVVMLVGFPILALDEIGVELQNPFSESRLNHLPLTELCATIERNLTALVADLPEPSPARNGQGPDPSRRDADEAARLAS
ncbi:Bestrophin, RFP-TM, chloride channel [Aquisphaera giovannonii]|uniref:Bestrophin, RFP-TM, chloride channel n=1 Tax=Aquisphaera giovannonii TaxID=406548 RepID=A0A5B9VXB8_9BACT|nr:bestrophin family ion channel [Aquisphaera giovannonii]QEH33026.1 Bestrophin, RFP-TM, chloride channel [Aquisphaera giovannonii]